MHDNRSILEQRIQRTLIERILPAQTTTIGAINLEAWRIPLDTVDGCPVVAEPVPFEVASKAPFVPFAVGSSWGAPWQTTWFRATVTIPELTLNGQDRLEAVIDLGWDDHSVGFQCEAQVVTWMVTPLKRSILKIAGFLSLRQGLSQRQAPSSS